MISLLPAHSTPPSMRQLPRYCAVDCNSEDTVVSLLPFTETWCVRSIWIPRWAGI